MDNMTRERESFNAWIAHRVRQDPAPTLFSALAYKRIASLSAASPLAAEARAVLAAATYEVASSSERALRWVDAVGFSSDQVVQFLCASVRSDADRRALEQLVLRWEGVEPSGRATQTRRLLLALYGSREQAFVQCAHSEARMRILEERHDLAATLEMLTTALHSAPAEAVRDAVQWLQNPKDPVRADHNAIRAIGELERVLDRREREGGSSIDLSIALKLACRAVRDLRVRMHVPSVAQIVDATPRARPVARYGWRGADYDGL